MGRTKDTLNVATMERLAVANGVINSMSGTLVERGLVPTVEDEQVVFNFVRDNFRKLQLTPNVIESIAQYRGVLPDMWQRIAMLKFREAHEVKHHAAKPKPTPTPKKKAATKKAALADASQSA